MSCTDKIAIENILKLRDEFDIQTSVATGTYKGFDAELYASYFKEVYSMDVEEKYIYLAKQKLAKYPNVSLFLMSSAQFITEFRAMYEAEQRSDIVYFYLDAHFYNPNASPEDRWVVVSELKALEGFPNCVLAIHDYDNGELGHLVYDGEHLGWNVIGEYVTKVNPDFHYYTNTKEWCGIYDEETIRELPITIDDDLLDVMKFVNSSDVKRYRGILYAVPRKLDLVNYKLKEYEQARADKV